MKEFDIMEDYKQNNINMYISEGTYVANCSIENTYNDTKNLGKIFRVEKKLKNLLHH